MTRRKRARAPSRTFIILAAVMVVLFVAGLVAVVMLIANPPA